MRYSRSPSPLEPDYVLTKEELFTWARKTGLLATAQHFENVRPHEDIKATPESRIHQQLITWIVQKARLARLKVEWEPALEAEAYVFLRDGTSLADLKKFLRIDEVSFLHSTKDY